MIFALILLVSFRLADRVWHSRYRNPVRPVLGTSRQILALQRDRLNNVTPALLILSIWIEILLLIAVLGSRPMFWGPLAVMVGMRGRHLQEITHFAVHGVLTRNRQVGDLLATISFQAVLMLPNTEVRRRSHVREHHPNATVVGVDPNMSSLVAAGLRRGWGARAFLATVLHPLTPPGLGITVAEAAHNVWRQRGRQRLLWLLLPAGLLALAFMLAGWPGVVVGCLIPRFLIYPAFSWLSLIVEHRWFNGSEPTGVVLEDEAARCLRLYRSRPVWRSLARLTWLPYGDAFHFAHSVHPAVRWNYLVLIDELLVADVKEFGAVLVGSDSVLIDLFRKGAGEPTHA